MAGHRTRAVTALLAAIGQVRARELDELRQELTQSRNGGWGIVFDPGRAYWIGVRGKHTTVYAHTAQELRERIVSGTWNTLPLAVRDTLPGRGEIRAPGLARPGGPSTGLVPGEPRRRGQR